MSRTCDARRAAAPGQHRAGRDDDPRGLRRPSRGRCVPRAPGRRRTGRPDSGGAVPRQPGRAERGHLDARAPDHGGHRLADTRPPRRAVPRAGRLAAPTGPSGAPAGAQGRGRRLDHRRLRRPQDHDGGLSSSSTPAAGRSRRATRSLVERHGPLSGLWLVKEIDRSAFSTEADITLVRRTPALPEPKPEPRDDGTTTTKAASTDGGKVVTGKVSARGLSWPLTGPVSSGFGSRGGRLHAGVDIAVPIGTPVRAAADGTVAVAGAVSGYGNAVYIEHAGGLFTRYGHLSRLQVRAGQAVKRGEQIALSGNTGNSTGPHLHFEVRPGNHPVDPRTYLP